MKSLSGRTFYISSINGKAGNDGLSPSSPFLSICSLDASALKPGDSVLLERGSVFKGEALHITSSGAKDNPIVVSAYGSGALPVIETEGKGVWLQDYGVMLDSPVHVYKGRVSSSVLLYDAEYITVENIELTNTSPMSDEEYTQPHRMDRTGVSVIAKDRGCLHSITLRNLVIHDVDGNVYNKHMNNGGIYISASKPEDEEKSGVARFEHLLISGCTVFNVSRWGIAAGYTYRHADFASAYLSKESFVSYGHLDMVIEDCYTACTGGDGITAMYALSPVLRNNTVEYAAVEMNDRWYRHPDGRMGKVAAGLWAWKCLDADIYNNYVSSTSLNQDGMAYDADSGDGAVYHDNYSYFNEGGCMMFCLEQAVDSVFSDNISFDDLSGTFSSSECPNGIVRENTFYVRRNTPFIRNNMGDGIFEDVDNKFEYLPAGSYPKWIYDEIIK